MLVGFTLPCAPGKGAGARPALTRAAEPHEHRSHHSFSKPTAGKRSAGSGVGAKGQGEIGMESAREKD